MIYKYLVTTTIISLMLIQCKSTDKQDPGPKVDVARMALNCAATPPVRTDYREDGATIESQGPVELGGKPCEEIAGNKDELQKTLKTGPWVNYFPGGNKVQSKGNFAAGRRTGAWETFSESGALLKAGTYKEGKLDGTETTYFEQPDNAWKSKATYAMGIKNGLWSDRKAADSTCITEGGYASGLKHGNWKECRQDPQTKQEFVSMQGSYQNGMRNGAFKLFHSASQLQSQGSFRPDADCIAKLADADKQTAEKVEQCSRPMGKWVFFHANGAKHSEGVYDDAGRRSGTWNEYYKTGSLMGKGDHVDGKKNSWTFFTKNGAKHTELGFEAGGAFPKRVKLFENGKLVSEGEIMMGNVTYDPEKDELVTKEFNKKGVWTEYHANGKKSGEGEFTMNKRKGPWKHYDESGKLIAEGSYSMGEKQGAWKELSGGTMVDRTYFMGKPK